MGVNLKVGDTFGLWKVTALPKYLPRGEVMQVSKCTCLCANCGKEFQVQVRNLVGGKSKGCQKCRATEHAHNLRKMGIKGGRVVNKNNPFCKQCGERMLVYSPPRKSVKQGGVIKWFKCPKCKITERHFFSYESFVSNLLESKMKTYAVYKEQEDYKALDISDVGIPGLTKDYQSKLYKAYPILDQFNYCSVEASSEEDAIQNSIESGFWVCEHRTQLLDKAKQD